MAQPTEQCVQTVRLTSTFKAPEEAGSAAPALRTRVSWEIAKPAPTPSPELRKNLRLSIVGMERDSPRARPSTSPRCGDAAAGLADFRVNNIVSPE